MLTGLSTLTMPFIDSHETGTMSVTELTPRRRHAVVLVERRAVAAHTEQGRAEQRVVRGHRRVRAERRPRSSASRRRAARRPSTDVARLEGPHRLAEFDRTT